MAKKKSKRTRYTTGGRVDMSKGGRVGFAEGDVVIDPRTGKAVPAIRTTPETSMEQNVTPNVPQQAMAGEPTNISQQPVQKPIALQGEATTPITPPTQAQIGTQQYIPTQEDIQAAAQERGRLAAEQAGIGTTGRDTFETDREGWWTQYGYGSAQEALQTGRFQMDPVTRQWVLKQDTTTTTTAPLTQETFEAERRQRMIETGREAGAIARGEIPEGMIPTQEIVSVPTGPEYESEAIQLAQRKGVTPEYVKEVGLETVRQMEDVAEVTAPTPLTAAQMEAAQITEAPEVTAARAAVSPEALAEAARVERVEPIEAAKVEIIPGALTERVIGSLSTEAKAQAAQVAGTTLSRITRAKKQLSNAGVSDEDIAELGNDPEALEARLADFSEAQRGIIAGLPQEALVSNQLDSLLAGIEEGEIPTWAGPAVASVEAMLAQRGLSASTVGRDALFNAIIQSAIPLAQSNAQAIQQSVSQQRSIEAQVELTNAQFRQQTALSNADKVFQLNMAQFSSDQQIALSNSKFLQTVGLTEASMEQQSVMQNAVLMSQANLAEADFYQKAQIQNAQAFLQMDVQNLNNQQQANVLKAQQQQQILLSNQSAQNAARQFNAASENQTQQFMASLSSQVEQFNAQQVNAANQFNVQQQNAAEARRVANQLEINKANAAIVNQTKQFNEQIEFNRVSFNAQNAQAIEQSNIEWRRKANLANTVAQNEANRLNVQNAFSLSSQAQSFLWQELRDQADYDFKWAVSSADRKVNAMIAAASTEGEAAKNWSTNFNNVSSTLDRLFGT
jgi:hypothetical protein